MDSWAMKLDCFIRVVILSPSYAQVKWNNLTMSHTFLDEMYSNIFNQYDEANGTNIKDLYTKTARLKLSDWKVITGIIVHDDVIKWKHFPCYWDFVTDGFPSQRPVTRSFVVFFDLRLNKLLGKQWRHRWFETTLRSLWRYCYTLFVIHD